MMLGYSLGALHAVKLGYSLGKCAVWILFDIVKFG